MDDPAERTRRIRRVLGDLWGPVFGSFGRLTPIQLEALPALLERRDAVLASPTASGKSEAALAPALLDLRRHPGEAAGLLWVIPTRALVADLARRFGDLLRALDVPAAFRTSDRPGLPAGLRALFTTPESLDSLLCRRPALFAGLRTVILDELHLLDGTPRGDQLRVLLRRLEKDHLSAPPHRLILSATVADPAALAARHGAAGARVFTAGSARPIDLGLAPTLDEAVAACRAAGRHKILVFCNARRDCERLAGEAAARRLWPAGSILVHHGSLSAAVRRETEAALRESRAALCFCTMTLELGVDIGDVDAVILHGPPPSRDAFHQRAGRACRREERIFAVGVAATPEETLLYEALRDAPAVAEEPPPPDPSVAVQQILSMVFAAPRGRALAELEDRVSPLCDAALFRRLTDHLLVEGLLRRAGPGRVAATEAVMDLGERGTLHTNLDEPRVVTVVDGTSGKTLGEVAWDGRDAPLVLAGRSWTVSPGPRGTLVARPAGPSAAGAAFAPRRSRGRFARWLPPTDSAGSRAR